MTSQDEAKKIVLAVVRKYEAVPRYGFEWTKYGISNQAGSQAIRRGIEAGNLVTKGDKVSFPQNEIKGPMIPGLALVSSTAKEQPAKASSVGPLDIRIMSIAINIITAKGDLFYSLDNSGDNWQQTRYKDFVLLPTGVEIIPESFLLRGVKRIKVEGVVGEGVEYTSTVYRLEGSEIWFMDPVQDS